MANEQMDFLASIQEEQWAMEPGRLGAFMDLIRGAARVSGDELLAQAAARPERQATRAGKTAHIPVRGVLMKRVPAWLKFFGIEATSYQKVSEQLKAAVADGGVDTVVLDVESPGGSIGGVQELADEIYAARKTKNVKAHIDDVGASGAYWLASQADEVVATANSIVGSIGVYSVFYDSSKAFEKEGIEAHVIRSGENKGMGIPGDPITKEQIKSAQSIIDGMAENFKAAVQRGRGMTDKAIKAVSDGQAWIAIEAKGKGLIDRIGTMDSIQEEIMSKENESAAAMDLVRTEAAATEKKRFADIKAAFPADAVYAMEAFEKGLTVVEAKADYSDILQGRMKEMEKKAKKETPAPAPAARGAEPIVSEGEPSQGSADFVGEAKRMAAAESIGLDKAMSKLAVMKPELHEAFMDKARTQGRRIKK